MANRKFTVELTDKGPNILGGDGITLHEMISVGASLISGSIHQMDNQQTKDIVLEEIIKLLRDNV